MTAETEISREWLPAAWLDEVTPELQDSPEAFAEFHDGKWRMIPPAALAGGQGGAE